MKIVDYISQKLGVDPTSRYNKLQEDLARNGEAIDFQQERLNKSRDAASMIPSGWTAFRADNLRSQEHSQANLEFSQKRRANLMERMRKLTDAYPELLEG